MSIGSRADLKPNYIVSKLKFQNITGKRDLPGNIEAEINLLNKDPLIFGKFCCILLVSKCMFPDLRIVEVVEQ